MKKKWYKDKNLYTDQNSYGQFNGCIEIVLTSTDRPLLWRNAWANLSLIVKKRSHFWTKQDDIIKFDFWLAYSYRISVQEFSFQKIDVGG